MKVDNKAIRINKFPMTQVGKYKINKSYIFTDENIKLLIDNPYQAYRLRRVINIPTKEELKDERARCESHCRYQSSKLAREQGLKIQFKVISRWLVDEGFVEVYVQNLKGKPNVGYAGTYVDLGDKNG
tara:strand:- start:41 stop:424 length:384 start_codon:yes stop_codon:yes gene_type:complete